ncbi:MAG TPA: DUF6580 family putative transport protein [Verrucomicrobiae bacterium]
MKKNLGWPLLLVLVFALSRWPGLLPNNFSAAYALVFCAGLYLTGTAGWIIPLAVMAGSDLIISLVFYPQYFSWTRFLADQAPNYIAYAGLIGLGRSVGHKKPWWLLVCGGMVGAMLFYLVTNTASWLILGYAKTWAGWIKALTTGLPGHAQTWEFFRNTLSSGGLFTGLFVGAMKMTEAEEEKDEEAEDEREAAEPETEPAEAET